MTVHEIIFRVNAAIVFRSVNLRPLMYSVRFKCALWFEKSLLVSNVSVVELLVM